MDIIVGLTKLFVENFEFVGVICGGHLAEVVGRRERAADDAVDRFAEIKAADFLGGAGAVDRAEHCLNFNGVGAERGQIRRSESATAQHVAEGELCASPVGVGAELEITGVVQEHRGEGEFKLPSIHRRLNAGDVPAFENKRDANRRLQRVLEIVIANVDGGVVRMPALEELPHVPENILQPREARPWIHRGELLFDKRFDGDGVFGVNRWKHGLRWLWMGRLRAEFGGSNRAPIKNLRNEAASPILGKNYYS